VTKILGLTGKPEEIDGSKVEKMVAAGQIEEVARYCESDVLSTYRIWGLRGIEWVNLGTEGPKNLRIFPP
jgi:Predicted 3'-5' exonuclease related to the exonuclease domain of PolB